jgi:hypothetical protein
MTAKEKAQELVLKYSRIKTHKIFNGWCHKITAQQCALIAVDEILKLHKKLPLETLEYYVQVKNEIQKP